MNEKKTISCPNCNKKVSVPIGKHIKFTCPECNEKLEFNDIESRNETIASQVEQEDEKSTFGNSIINFISWILAVPIFIILHKYIPDPDWVLNLDRLLIALFTIITLRLILREFKIFVLVAFFVAIIWLGYGSLWGNYGFVGVYRDYKAMIHSMIDSPNPERIVISQLKPFNNKSLIKKAIDFDNPEVRNYALTLTKDFQYYSEEYPNYRTIIQCFAIFKNINKNWNYVSDPKSSEYFAKASETVEHLSGDCDDHAILMAACIKSIGGIPRLVATKGHLYPELLIGTKKDMEAINFLIKRKLFRYESMDQKINYHIDEENQVWLNLDYTAKYPGGPFMSEEIIGVLTLISDCFNKNHDS